MLKAVILQLCYWLTYLTETETNINNYLLAQTEIFQTCIKKVLEK